jgi:tRNA pseudouridine55 synthase
MACMDGVLIIDKPAGLTSHDVVARVRKIIRERRVGHTGTLDPFATGVLVVLVGRATRLAQFLSGAEKEYEAVIRLGYATDTGDLTGQRLEPEKDFAAEAQRTQNLRRDEIDAALASLRGETEQTPPMYSAKKVDGRKLYELARSGEQVERQPVRITVSQFTALNGDGDLLTQHDDGTCDLAVRVVCSAGTYVRTLAEDFGRRLSLGAHLAALRRTRAGEFKIEDALTLESLAEVAESDSWAQALISLDAALSHLPYRELSTDDARRTSHGIELPHDGEHRSSWADGQPVRLRDAEGRLLAVGIFDQARQTLRPKVVVANT